MCLDASTSDAAVRIPLRARDGSIRAYVVVDVGDADWLNRWRWKLDVNGYAVRSGWKEGTRGTFRLQREIFGLSPSDTVQVDHRNRDRLDCRRANLRVLPAGGNDHNRSSYKGSSSGYRGVTWDKRARKWRAQVKSKGQNHHLGLFDLEEEAAKVAAEARIRLLAYSLD